MSKLRLFLFFLSGMNIFFASQQEPKSYRDELPDRWQGAEKTFFHKDGKVEKVRFYSTEEYVAYCKNNGFVPDVNGFEFDCVLTLALNNKEARPDKQNAQESLGVKSGKHQEPLTTLLQSSQSSGDDHVDSRNSWSAQPTDSFDMKLCEKDLRARYKKSKK